jgi:hypothetical protein
MSNFGLNVSLTSNIDKKLRDVIDMENINNRIWLPLSPPMEPIILIIKPFDYEKRKHFMCKKILLIVKKFKKIL